MEWNQCPTARGDPQVEILLVTCTRRRERLHQLENELEAADAGASRRSSYLSYLSQELRIGRREGISRGSCRLTTFPAWGSLSE